MANINTKIEWTDKTWSPVTGCSKVSPGCQHCYAETLAKRFWKDRKFTDVRMHEDRLSDPLKWRKPSMVFVNSMSDLFHEDVPFEFIDRVFAVMLACSTLINKCHTFQILTKRPERMVQYFTSGTEVEHLKAWADAGDRLVTLDNEDMLFSETVFGSCCHDWDKEGRNTSGSEYKPWGYPHQIYPLPNVWLGVSVENQKETRRLDILREIPNAMPWVSYEPALEAVDFSPWLGFLKWVVIGGESGSGARPFDIRWGEKVIYDCKAAGATCFVKQLGTNPVQPDGRIIGNLERILLRDRKGGNPSEWPAYLRVREFPTATDSPAEPTA